MSALTLPAELLTPLLAPMMQAAIADFVARQPAADPWLTIPEAAAYAKLTDKYMALLVLGRPFRAGTSSQPERAAIAPKIPSGDTGFARGARVRQSAVDTYLTRHAYHKNAA